MYSKIEVGEEVLPESIAIFRSGENQGGFRHSRRESNRIQHQTELSLDYRR